MIQLIASVIFALTFSKAEFFKSLESKDKEAILAMEQKVSAATPNDDQRAYFGAVTMKSADYGKTPADKLQKFKDGKDLLEKSIAAQPNNVEYRFLRLLIQENAPKFLKYHSEVESDASFIKENIAKAPKEVKTAIQNYAKVSNSLNL